MLLGVPPSCGVLPGAGILRNILPPSASWVGGQGWARVRRRAPPDCEAPSPAHDSIVQPLFGA